MAEDSRRKSGLTPLTPLTKKGGGADAVPSLPSEKASVGPALAPPVSPAVVDTPFAAGDDEWESELAAWDAAIPIVNRAPIAPPFEAAGAQAVGAMPDAENPFADTPTTVVSAADQLDLDDLPDMVSAGTFDDGMAPASGSYAALVATDESAPGIFDREPAPDEPPVLRGETLREMTAGPWRDEIGALFVLGDAGQPVPPARAYLETLGRVLAEERALANDKQRTIGLCLAAARVADLLGHPKEALAHIEAGLVVDAATPAAHRAVLGLAERAERTDDERVAESLARLALTPHPDQPYYRALHAEWTLARAARGVVDRTASAAITALPEGLGRTLAEAELAWGEPPVAAAILEGAAHRVGNGLGAAFLLCAAGLNEVASDFQAAAEQRFVATRLDDQRSLLSLGVLRDLARGEPDALGPALEELLPRVPPSRLRVALARWGAAAACRSGDLARAWRFVSASAQADAATQAEAATMTVGLARDRMDLWPVGAPAIAPPGEAGVPDSLPRLFAPLDAVWSAATTRIVLALRACELAAGPDDSAFAIAAAEDAVQGASDVAAASALGPAVEELAKRVSDSATRVRALRLWRRIDPARWTAASLDLADALVPTPDGGTPAEGPDSTESVLGEIAVRDGTSPIFWSLAALEARRGRYIEAAAQIDRGLERAAWRDSPLAAPLSELAAELTARADLAAGASRLGGGRTNAVSSEMPRRTLGRMLRRLGDRDLWADYVETEIAAATSAVDQSERARARRVALLLEPVFWRSEGGDGEDVPSLVSAALDVFPLHPTAIGLALRGKPEPVTLVDRFVAGRSGPAGTDWALGAAIAAAVAGDTSRALALALAAEPRDPGDDQSFTAPLSSAAKATIRRLVWVEADVARRGRILKNLGEIYSPGDLSIHEQPERSNDRLAPLLEAASVDDWEDVVASLVDSPPQEETPGADILTLAAMIDEGRCQGRRAREVWTCARAALSFPAAGDTRLEASEPTSLLRAGDRRDVDPAEAGAALEHLAGLAARALDPRSASLFLVEAARLAGGVSDLEAASTVIERCLHAAVIQDPTSARAAIAWRRWLWVAGRTDEAARASAAEAEALVDPGLRMQALLRAAAMLVTPVGVHARGGQAASDAGVDRVTEAAGFLQRALEISPLDHEAFTRLRDLYEEAGRDADLARLLAARMAVTSNPFEVTALHLARAELFAGPLGDHQSARAELEAILQKEPQHARALARLADLETEDGNSTAAADLLIRSAFIERSPEKLRELFLRLGRIYTHHLPDAKRAVGAYARVLQVDANNREALDELSRLYLGLGETKSAMSITERLVQMETVPDRRSRYHMRLGQLSERASDPRAAGIHFRRAAEDAPRDIEALGELIRHLEKTRDAAGRRAYLDRAAGELRAAVLADPSDLSALDALIAVSRWRGRAASAAAAAELAVFVGASVSAGGAGEQGTSTARHAPTWATSPTVGRALAALSKASVDEQTFPADVSPSVRHLFRLLGPTLWEGRADLARYGVERGDRVAAGRPPRDVFDGVAAELAAGPFELYLDPARDAFGAVTLAVEPGKPPAIIMGGALIKLGPAAVRFAAGRSLRLIATHLDLALSGEQSELGLWLGAVIRQFVPEYSHPDVSSDALAQRTARVAKLMPRRQRQEIMPFAMESSGALDFAVLRAGIREGANRVGLLASGSLVAGLRVVLATSDAGSAVVGDVSPVAVARNPEARALLAFALSDDYDELVKALE